MFSEHTPEHVIKPVPDVCSSSSDLAPDLMGRVLDRCSVDTASSSSSNKSVCSLAKFMNTWNVYKTHIIYIVNIWISVF